MRLDRAGGFVFDLDGTLIQRTAGGMEVVDGAVEVLAAIRASGRPLVACTNASAVTPEAIGAELRAHGLELADDEVITAACSGIAHIARRYPGAPVLAFASAPTAARMLAAGIELVDSDTAAVVFVAQADDVDFPLLERAARAILGGAPLLTGSYVPAYAGANGPVFSRGAMLTAALAKVTGARPRIVGKPSRASVREIVDRLGVASEELVVVGDDIALDVALGRLGGSHTILVRSGISGAAPLDRLPESRRPHEIVDGVAALIDRI